MGVGKFVCGFFMMLFSLVSLAGLASGDSKRMGGAVLGFAIVYSLYRLGFGRKSVERQAQVMPAVQAQAVSSSTSPACVYEVDRAIDTALQDGGYTVEEEQAILHMASQLNVPIDGILAKKMWQGAYYRDLRAGVDRRCPFPWPAGFVPQAGERLVLIWTAKIWIWGEQKTYVGGTSGVSYRLTKRITVRTSGTRGHMETSKGFSLLGTGTVVVTSQALLYACGTHAERIPLTKVVHARAVKGGVEIQFAGRTKPMMIGTGWNDVFFGICLLNARLIK
jgi:hypothetical protein